MNNSMKMNNFLQRMLKKNDEEVEGERVVLDSTSLKVEYSPRRNKTNWIKKLGAYSPSKRDSSPSLRSPSRPITPSQPAGHRNDYRRRSVPEPLTPKHSAPVVEMPNLEDIIHEFEVGFLSPTKQEIKETNKSGRFVKKIVAAFEEKYKVYNEYKMSAERSSQELYDQETTLNGSRTTEQDMEESTAFLGTTYVIDSLESRLSHYLDSFDSKSVRYSCHSSDSVDLSKCSFAMDEELTVSTPAKYSPESEKLQDGSIVLNETLEESMNKSNTQSKTLIRSNSSIRRERQPKIVGAFLKKPIEVEDTSINWIPITGKKLPRKKSFKRLLSVLTGKNRSSDKSSKLYSSQMNLQEETSKDLHDSGYDEKSCSSSSLTSLVSITDLLLQQDNYEIEANRRNAPMTTFKKSSSSVEHDINDYHDDLLVGDDSSDSCSVSSKRLLLEELPRSECRLSLGPAFKPKFVARSADQREPMFVTKNFDIEDSFEEISSAPPLAPSLPKHPFVSEKDESSYNGSLFDEQSNMNFSEFNTIELRRDCQSWKFPSSEVTYDTPRRYLSKSEPGLYRQPTLSPIPSDEVVYDVPKPKIPQRPKSSVYEDALSLKRRNANFSCTPPASGFYAFPSQEEPHYATVKPRNTRINPSRELLRSVGDLSSRELENGKYYARVIDEIRYL